MYFYCRMVAFNYRCEEQKQQQQQKLCFSVKTQNTKLNPQRSHKVSCQSGHQIKAKKSCDFFYDNFYFPSTDTLVHIHCCCCCCSSLFVFQRTASSKEISNEEETQVFEIFSTLFFLFFSFLFS